MQQEDMHSALFRLFTADHDDSVLLSVGRFLCRALRRLCAGLVPERNCAAVLEVVD